MKMIFDKNSFIVLLLIIVTSCIAWNVRNQTSKLSCDRAYSYLTVCPNRVYGNLSFIEPYTNDCDTTIIDMHMNLSNLTDTLYFHHYRGNIITQCAPNDISNYTIIGHAYFTDNHFNGTASMCNDDCVDIFFKGKYELHGGNGTCYRVFTLGPVC
ncbi:hypothetical protein I4U23_011621 [Adineta vaga]|nr:hypothetical protein I4U23_011621 [Adineta vaga]